MAPIERSSVNWGAVENRDRGWRERCARAEAEVERLQDAIRQALESAQVASAPHASRILREALDG